MNTTQAILVMSLSTSVFYLFLRRFPHAAPAVFFNLIPVLLYLLLVDNPNHMVCAAFTALALILTFSIWKPIQLQPASERR